MNFEDKGNKILKNMKIALLNKVTKIDKNKRVQINAVLSKYHGDPSEGVHSSHRSDSQAPLADKIKISTVFHFPFRTWSQ